MQMQASWFLKSKRFWGIAITAASAVLPAVGPFLGWEVSAAQIAAVGEAGGSLIQAGFGFIGVTLALFGSAKAKGPMTLTRQ